MPPEITSRGQALSLIQDIFGTPKVLLPNSTDEPKDATEAYAAIAEYLSSTDAVFHDLEQVSTTLWAAYNSNQAKESRGRFTTAIQLAAREAGFLYDDIVVTSGALAPPVFLDLIRNGVLWKDSFAPDHGEFSHAFQWLAIHQHFQGKLGHSVSDLYRWAAINRARSPILLPVLDEPPYKMLKTTMWPWLCDCFPYSRFPIQREDHKATLAHNWSDTCRTPNTIEKCLRDSKDWFLGSVVRYRANKNLLATESTTDGTTDIATLKELVDELLRLTDTGLNAEARSRYIENNLNMITTAKTLKLQRPTSRYQQKTGERVFVRKLQELDPHKHSEQGNHAFHGTPGVIPKAVLTNSPLPLKLSSQDTISTTRGNISSTAADLLEARIHRMLEELRAKEAFAAEQLRIKEEAKLNREAAEQKALRDGRTLGKGQNKDEAALQRKAVFQTIGSERLSYLGMNSKLVGQLIDAGKSDQVLDALRGLKNNGDAAVKNEALQALLIT